MVDVMQTASSRVWIWATKSISYDDNHYTTSMIYLNNQIDDPELQQ